jgi:hypothetical protein
LPGSFDTNYFPQLLKFSTKKKKKKKKKKKIKKTKILVNEETKE